MEGTASGAYGVETPEAISSPVSHLPPKFPRAPRLSGAARRRLEPRRAANHNLHKRVQVMASDNSILPLSGDRADGGVTANKGATQQSASG